MVYGCNNFTRFRSTFSSLIDSPKLDSHPVQRKFSLELGTNDYPPARKFLLVLMAFSAHLVICRSSKGNETDRLSLLQFREAISLDPQDALMSWNKSTHLCNWEGVMCRKKTPPRVISLNLTNRECATGGDDSCAADVYSFGIVLLEILLRKRPTDDMFTDGLNITKFVEMNFPNTISQIVDPELLEYQHDGLSQEASVAMRETLACLLSLLGIGIHCTKASPSERMDMREVAATLHAVMEAYLRGN
ncbi:hypothetical protein QOZ80_9BG0694670 [Eleusine coracana subsp. coracana]|nr:hypothetical protein QOZ80_9BG0694670 [Eleusine coracana subsp. coracana]